MRKAAGWDQRPPRDESSRPGRSPNRRHHQGSEIAAGDLSLDRLTREFIQTELGFRFQKAADHQDALVTEKQIQRGALQSGKPFLNPLATLA
jgi:hypothetical protein